MDVVGVLLHGRHAEEAGARDGEVLDGSVEHVADPPGDELARNERAGIVQLAIDLDHHRSC